MPLEHTLLELSQLSEEAQKALGPGPARMMAARGLAPLADPVDLASVLYQLAQDPDAKIADSARKTAADLPDRVVQGALSDARTDARVLDFMVGIVGDNTDLRQLIILNTATADETIADMAAGGAEREIDMIARNEERLIRHPAIIGAMYGNGFARMSTVDRAIEIAVRSDIKVPGIPMWEEVRGAVLGTKRRVEGDALPPQAEPSIVEQPAPADEVVLTLEQEDLLFTTQVDTASKGEEERGTGDLPINRMSIPMKVRLAFIGNKFQRSVLVRDSNKLVALAAIKSPSVNEMEAARYAGNAGLSDDVIHYISRKRDWTKRYGVKLSLVQNPKTPLPVALRFLSFLRDKDLRMIARSRNVPAVVSAGARKRLARKNK